MYIHRVILQGVPGVPDRDLTFVDEWSEKSLRSVLLTGPNGTGKTTMLRVIAGLWEQLGNWVKYPDIDARPEATPEILRHSDLTGIEIYGLADKPLWIYETAGYGQANVVEQEAKKANALVLGGQQGSLISGVEVTSENWFKELGASARRLQTGITNDKEMLPNLVYLASDIRQIVHADNPDFKIEAEPLYKWLVTYHAENRFNEHLEGMLRNLKLRDPEWFAQTLDHINSFLLQNGKRLRDFSENLRLSVESNKDGKQPTFHRIDELSSGEQQCLILIFMVSRWLMAGGVAMIDEPDLHMHGSWQRSLIHELEKIVEQRNGQLIVTSHSSLVVEEYSAAQRFHLEGEPQHS